MLFGGAQDKRELFTRRASTEQEGHDERMWKPNLGSVHDTIAETLEDRKQVMVCWIERNLRQALLKVRHSSNAVSMVEADDTSLSFNTGIPRLDRAGRNLVDALQFNDVALRASRAALASL